MTRHLLRLLSTLALFAILWVGCGGGSGSDAGPGSHPGVDGAWPGEVGPGLGLPGTGGIGGGGDGGAMALCGRPGFPCCPGSACSEGGCCVLGVCAATGAICGTLGGVCGNGVCGTCGGPGLNCCSAGGTATCTAANTGCANGICVLCGGVGMRCCAGAGSSACPGSGLVCSGDVCVPGTPDAAAGGTIGGQGGMGGGQGGSTSGRGGMSGGQGGMSGSGGTTTCSCTAGTICSAEGRCILPGTIDDFGSCDKNIYTAEGRAGTWFSYMGSGVTCESSACAGVSTVPWGTACGAWIQGGLYDALGEIFAGIGVGLDKTDVTYDACGYSAVEVTYASDQSIRMYAKWNDTGELGTRSATLLPASAGVTTTTVSLSAFTGVVCSKLTELQFEPSSIPAGFGIAIYGLRFLGTGGVACSEGDARCSGSGALERCVGGAWTSSSCAAGQTCVGDRCVSATTTPVQLHGNLSVSGTRLVDAQGSPVRLTGVSSQWLNYESDGYATNLTALIWMRDNWKLSVIRAAMGVDPDQTGAYLYSAAGKANMQAQVETIIQNAVAAGVYVIVDWHSHMAEQYPSEANAFFKDISQRYGQYPNVIYESYNEPLKVAWTTLKQYHQGVYTSIRSYDADANQNVILLGTPNWDQDVDVAAANPMAGDTNIMYTLHFYACSHNSLSGHLAKAETALAMGLPIFVSEWGATAADGGVGGGSVCTSYADEWHDWMDSNNISWAAWKLDDCDGLAVADTSCILKLGAPLTGGWGSDNLNGHGPYVVGKLSR